MPNEAANPKLDKLEERVRNIENCLDLTRTRSNALEQLLLNNKKISKEDLAALPERDVGTADGGATMDLETLSQKINKLETHDTSIVARLSAFEKLLVKNNAITTTEVNQLPAIDTKRQPPNKYRQLGSGALFLVIFIALVMVGYSILSHLYELKTPSTNLLDQFQFTLLSLVIALAAYIATVVRNIRDKIAEVNAGEKTVVNSVTWNSVQQENLRWLVRGEQLLVVFGILVAARILGSNLVTRGEPLVSLSQLDFFLLVFLLCTVLFLSWLHLRQWLR